VFHLSVSSVLLFPWCIQCLLMSSSLSSHYFFPFFYLFFNNVLQMEFLCKMWPIRLSFLLFIVCGVFLSPFILCNTSFFTPLVQLIHSDLSRCPWVECGPCPVFAYYAWHLSYDWEKKHGKNLSQGSWKLPGGHDSMCRHGRPCHSEFQTCH
jgi:hypothetical protein